MYAIELAPEFSEQSESLHPKRFKQIHLRIYALQVNPRPPDSLLLDEETYLVRVGPYVLTYKIDDVLRRIRFIYLEQMQEE
jgi:mRNA-degrading endonuclease RelE of RelBE toxin-antitoxin system